MKRFPLVFATLAFAAFSITTHAQAADSAGLARTKALVDTFIQVKSSDDDALSKADQAANAKVFTKLDGFFDFKRLTSDTVKKQASKFNAAQKADFEKTFTALIRLVAYPSSGVMLAEAKKDYSAAGKNAAKIHLFLEEEDFETDVIFKYHKVGGALRVYDVLFDGASLVKDYSNQFARLIKKNGVDGLIEKMKKRLKKEEESYAGE